MIFPLCHPNIKVQRGEGTVTKPEAKSEDAAPVRKPGAEISASVGKAEGEKAVPASKAAVSILPLGPHL